MAKTPSDLWHDCLDEIRSSVSETQYTNFFEPVTFEAYDHSRRTLLLQVPRRQIAEYLEDSFLPLLSEMLAKRFGQIRLEYHITETAAKTPRTVIAMGKQPTDGITIATHLNPHYTFDTFIEGDSNKLARSVGLSIAEHPRRTNFNPLFVYGPSGCGKTHLLNAIGNRTCELYPRKKVVYVDARQFQLQYTNSVAANTTNAFLEDYFAEDMLIVDDVQEWEGRRATLATFFHIFNHLFMSGKHIVLAADRTPAELRQLDERMLTRFACGIMTELGRPNPQLCYDILQAKIRRDGLAIPRQAVEYIARHANGSVRDLEGVINSLLAYSTFVKGDIDMQLVRTVVERCQRHLPATNASPQTIIDTVCRHYGIDSKLLTSKSQRHEAALARQTAMYMLYHQAHMTISQIGRLMDRNHATVAYGIQRTAQAMKNEREREEEMKSIEKEISAAGS